MKKFCLFVSVSLMFLGSSNFVFADSNADNAKWVAQCISDNKDEGQAIDVLTTYCNCMNDKMSADETKSISAWEKTHKAEEEECAKTANWVNKISQ
jgi:hypothetical protein